MSRIGDLIIEICELYEIGLDKDEIAKKLNITREWIDMTLDEYYHALIGEEPQLVLLFSFAKITRSIMRRRDSMRKY